MSGQKRFTRYIGVAISILGLVVIALGVFFITAGFTARSEVQTALAEEQVTVTIDDVKVPVTDQATAMAMVEVINGHTLGKYGTLAGHGARRPQQGHNARWAGPPELSHAGSHGA